MVQGYYTLQEAAQVLGMPPEELKQMAQKNQIRSFQDRGTWRFRVQDIQELARQRGATSDMELVLGEPSGPKSSTPKSSSGKGGPKTPGKAPGKAPDVFDFSLDLGEESVGLGQEVLGESPSRRGKPDSKKGPRTPNMPMGSDSDVRLVPDGSDMDFVFDGPNRSATSLAADSDVKLVGDSDAKRSQQSPRRSKLSGPRKSGLGPESPGPKKPSSHPPSAPPDSPVRLVPMDSDSDVKIIGSGSDEVSLGDLGSHSATDSDIRLEPASFINRPPPGAEEGMLTEEINLDEELQKQEAQTKQKPQAKVKPKSKLPKFPTSSPFELSSDDSQINLSPPRKAPAKEDSSDFDLRPAGVKPDSSDFDLSPASGKSDEGSSDEFNLELPGDSDFSLDLGGSVEGDMKAAASGISLGNPVDSGISLEQGGEGSDEIEFELSVDAHSTPRPQAKEAKSDSSEFELSLEDSGGPGLEPGTGDSSEFELTLDDSGSLAALDDEPAQAKAGKDKDIFETDFEVPGLEEESGSQVAALETDLDSSDFDLALDGSDVAAEDESGSQVVAVDEEEEAEEGAATVAAKRRPAGAALEEADEDLGFEQLGDEETVPEVEEDFEEAPARGEKVAVAVKAAPWGVLPVVVMLPCVVVMFLVGLMGLELVQHMTGYKPAGFLTKTISELVGQKTK